MKKEFNILSSNGITPYVVEFSFESGKLYVSCSCPAGVLGKWCKHKMQLISGDVSGAINTSSVADFVDVQNWVRNSEFPRLLDEIKSAEDEMQSAKTKINNVKKMLEKAAKNGLVV
jgi:hypothetical protein